jgi:hypothetical protein
MDTKKHVEGVTVSSSQHRSLVSLRGPKGRGQNDGIHEHLTNAGYEPGEAVVIIPEGRLRATEAARLRDGGLMGFNTTVVVHNDALHEIRDDKEFGKNLYYAALGLDLPASMRSRDVPAGCHANAAEVIEHHHADGLKLVAVGGNTGWDLGVEVNYRVAHEGSAALEEALLRALADKLGYRVSKKPARKAR